MSYTILGIDFSTVDAFYYFPALPYSVILLVIVFAPTIGYFDQLFQMIKTQSNEVFSLQSALIMLLSNVLRFFYWCHFPYETYLLGQSIAIFVIQFILSLLSFVYSIPSKDKKINFEHIYKYLYLNFSTIKNHQFQKLSFYLRTTNCKNLIDYVLSLSLYFVLIFLTYNIFSLLFGINFVGTVFIYSSSIIDTFVSVPTFIKIVVKKNIRQCSTVLLYQQIIGDALKLTMYLLGNSGAAFVFGAVLQSAIDLVTTFMYFRLRFEAGKNGKDFLMDDEINGGHLKSENLDF